MDFPKNLITKYKIYGFLYKSITKYKQTLCIWISLKFKSQNIKYMDFPKSLITS